MLPASGDPKNGCLGWRCLLAASRCYTLSRCRVGSAPHQLTRAESPAANKLPLNRLDGSVDAAICGEGRRNVLEIDEQNRSGSLHY